MEMDALTGVSRHTPISPPRLSLAAGLLRTARARQWVKNLLVAAAPVAAGVALEPAIAAPVAGAFVAFTLIAAGGYYFNDVADASEDRNHPEKRFRPVASGALPVGAALAAGSCAMLAGLGVAFLVGGWSLAAVMSAYLALQLSYTVGLKDIEVVDIVLVALGFVLRPIAGAVAADVAVTTWFLVVAFFGALFVVTGRRHAEHVALRGTRTRHRSVLGVYSLSFYQHVMTMSSAVALVTYSLWVFQRQIHADPWLMASIVPFGAAFLRYSLLVLSGEGGAPEATLLRDRGMLLLGSAWMALVLVGLYAG